jgi:integrase
MVPYRANRLVALLRKMFNLARDWGLYAGENHATRIHFLREESRDRFVQPEVLPRLIQAIAEEPDGSVRAVLMTALLTGARRTEMLTMRWEDASLTRAEWRIPQTKAGAPPSLAPAPRARHPAPTRAPGGRCAVCLSGAGWDGPSPKHEAGLGPHSHQGGDSGCAFS